MFYSLTFAGIQPHLKAALRWVYQKTFSAKDRIAFYDMLAFLLDNNKSLQQAFIDMRNVVTDFGRKHHPYAVLLTDCLSALDEGQGAFEKVLLEWVPVQEATLIGSGILSGKHLRCTAPCQPDCRGQKNDGLRPVRCIGLPLFPTGHRGADDAHGL